MNTIRSIRLDPAYPLEFAGPTTKQTMYENATKQMECGLWSGQPRCVDICYEIDEVCFVLEGKLRLTDEQGHVETYCAGDAFIIPAGFKGTWETLETVRKFFVVHRPAA